jgi:tetratricopeptide (TPR) repeat protein
VLTFAPLRRTVETFLLTFTLAATAACHAQSSSMDAQANAQTRSTSGRLILVLPFDNRTGQPNLEWIGDSFPDTLNQRLTSAGFLTITRDDRLYALDHLGLPATFRPTRATTIRMAQTLDADYVIVGSYTVRDGRITAQAQTLSINQLRLSQPLDESGQLEHLFDVENAIAWKVARQIDPHFKVAEQTFLAASTGVKLIAFESYIRGTDAANPDERESRLKQAVQTTPNYSAALLALGKTQYAAREYDQAATTLAKIPSIDRQALEAGFYLGLARFNATKYAAAETAFGFVASRLPLPEVVNNQAVAASRQGKDAVALFQRASTADPNDADYHYNLAVALLNRGDSAGSLREVEAALKLHSPDPEAAELRSRLISAKNSTGSALKAAVTANGFDPVVRIRRTYSEATFRQAAFQMDQMRAIRMATLPPAEQAAQYIKLGNGYMAEGLIPEAEQEFQSALTATPNSAEAHAGLAQIREHSGSPDDARTEAQSSLHLQPNVPAYLVLARLELQANDFSASASAVSNALRIEPSNTAALGMKQALATRGQSLP